VAAARFRDCPSVRFATIIAAAFATLLIAGKGQAFASAGCDAVNTLTPRIEPVNTGFGQNVNGPWAAGDTITVTGTPSANVSSFGTFVRVFTPAFRGANAIGGVATLTIAPAEISTNMNLGDAANGNIAGATFTFACVAGVPAPVPVPTPNTDSQNIRSLQTAITKSVATTSGAMLTSAVDGGIAAGFSSGSTPMSFGPNGGFMNFAAEPRSETTTSAEEAFGALGYAGNVYKAPPRAPLLEREWSAWADIRGTGWKANDTTGFGNDLSGSQVNLTAGLGRKLNTDTLVGVVVGYEHFKYDVAALAGSLKGDGETIGGYFARRFGGNLRFDAALAWTNLNYSATAGTATGSFMGSRWLASVGLTGKYKYDVYVIEPSAKVYALWESERAWTDSLGTLQNSRDFSAGRTALGAKIARPFDTSGGWTVSPYVGLYSDWRFQSDNALPTGTPVANIGTGWSGRVTTGLAARAAGGAMISLEGEYGGLGANYKIWSGNVRGTVPF
jgi:outer membrane autotransporter protein